MYFKDRDTALQVRSIHDDTSVETSRTKKCRIKNLRPVRCRQDQESFGRVKTVHLSKQLIQSLLSFIIPAKSAAVTCLSDCIDLIYEDDAGSIFLGFVKKIADTACTDADEHFHEFRSGQGEERNFRLSRYSLGQKRLTCTGRSHE